MDIADMTHFVKPSARVPGRWAIFVLEVEGGEVYTNVTAAIEAARACEAHAKATNVLYARIASGGQA